MKNYVWDLDGTLIDSYDAIIAGLIKTADFYNYHYDKDNLLNYIKNGSATTFLEDIATYNNLDFEVVKTYYREAYNTHNDKIKLIDHVKEIIDIIIQNGDQNYIITHRGISTYPILENLGIKDKFRCIVTTANKLPRKPDPTSLNYLIEKYNLNKDDVYYIGDRKLDIDFGENANVKTIFYKPSDSLVNNVDNATYIVDDLLKIKDIK